MMDITPKISAADYIETIEQGWHRKIYTAAEALDMLDDARVQISVRDPAHDLIAHIGRIEAGIGKALTPQEQDTLDMFVVGFQSGASDNGSSSAFRHMVRTARHLLGLPYTEGQIREAANRVYYVPRP